MTLPPFVGFVSSPGKCVGERKPLDGFDGFEKIKVQYKQGGNEGQS